MYNRDVFRYDRLTLYSRLTDSSNVSDLSGPVLSTTMDVTRALADTVSCKVVLSIGHSYRRLPLDKLFKLVL